MKKLEELKGKSMKELQQMCNDSAKHLFNLRFQKAAGESAVSMAEFKKTRKKVARIKTLMNNKHTNI